MTAHSRRRVRARLIASCVALGLVSAGGCAAGPTATAPTLTKLEAREIGEHAAARIALDQLYDVLIPLPFPDTPRPRMRQSDMVFWTRPRATAVADLCRTDLVRLNFDPVEHDRGADTRVRASGVAASPRFHFLSPPASQEPEWIEPDRQRAANAQCAGLEFFQDEFFAAPNERDAVLGYWMSSVVFAEYAREEPDFEIACSDSSTSCAELLALAQSEGLERIERRRVGSGVIATFGNSRIVQLRIDMRYAVGSWSIARVEVRELITVADERID